MWNNMNIVEIIDSDLPEADKNRLVAEYMRQQYLPEKQEENLQEWHKHFRTHGMFPISDFFFHVTTYCLSNPRHDNNCECRLDKILKAKEGLVPATPDISHTKWPNTEGSIFICETLDDAKNWLQTFIDRFQRPTSDYCILRLDLRDGGYEGYHDARNHARQRTGWIIEKEVEFERIEQVA